MYKLLISLQNYLEIHIQIDIVFISFANLLGIHKAIYLNIIIHSLPKLIVKKIIEKEGLLRLLICFVFNNQIYMHITVNNLIFTNIPLRSTRRL